MSSKSKTENRILKTANCNLLALILTGLKLTGCISLGWLWVLAPLWLPVTIFATVFTLLLTIKILHK